jgi:UDPglucose--hexose-1-phosphate uridylyltransferase
VTEAFFNKPHRRYNALAGEWVLVSPHRTQRPWQGQVEKSTTAEKPAYDAQCYLCPGNARAGGKQNPHYDSIFIFENDYPALLPDTPPNSYDQNDLLIAESERGVARVVCFTPRHDLSLSKMAVPAIRKVVDAWANQYQELGATDYVNYVQIFENRGEMMGASNPHPHCQIWAEEHIPEIPGKELLQQKLYYEKHGKSLLADYAATEMQENVRIVHQNDTWLTVVPFWAVWPFETLLISKRQVASLPDLTDAERDGLADALQKLTAAYDKLFDTPFPYSMGFHQAPTDGKSYPEQHLHAHFIPPLLRSATVRKFMVGYELLANPQRDITAESSAERLRSLVVRKMQEHR